MLVSYSGGIRKAIAGTYDPRTANQTVAYHEVGHALVGALMPGGGKVAKISIVPRGLGALGYTLQTPEEDRFLLLEDELRGKIATLLGGRAAELVVLNMILAQVKAPTELPGFLNGR